LLKFQSVEYHAIERTHWPTTEQRRIALAASKSAYDLSIELLDKAEKLVEESDEVRKQCHVEYWRYVRASLASTVTNFNNASVRFAYLAKVSEKSAEFIAGVASVGPEAMPQWAEKASAARNELLNAARAKATPSSVALSHALKDEGMPWAAVLEKYSKVVAAKKKIAVEALTTEDMLEVFDIIILKSGVTNWKMNAIALSSGLLSAAMLLMLIGTTVWDIVESQNGAFTATRDVFVIAASAAAGYAFETYGVAALHTWLVTLTWTTAESAGAMSAAAGFIGGFIITSLVAMAVDLLFELILSLFTLKIPPRLKNVRLNAIVVPLKSTYANLLKNSLVNEI